MHLIQLFDRFRPGFFGQPVFLAQHLPVAVDRIPADPGDVRLHLRHVVFPEESAGHLCRKRPAHDQAGRYLIRPDSFDAVHGIQFIGKAIGFTVQTADIGAYGTGDQKILQVFQPVFPVNLVQLLEIGGFLNPVSLRAGICPAVQDPGKRKSAAERFCFRPAHLVHDALIVVRRHDLGAGHHAFCQFRFQREGSGDDPGSLLRGIPHPLQLLRYDALIRGHQGLALFGHFPVFRGIIQQEIDGRDIGNPDVRVAHAQLKACRDKAVADVVFAAEHLRQLFKGGNRADPLDDFLQWGEAQGVARVPVHVRVVQMLHHRGVLTLLRGVAQDRQALIQDFILTVSEIVDSQVSRRDFGGPQPVVVGPEIEIVLRGVRFFLKLRDVFAEGIIDPGRPVVQDNAVFRRFFGECRAGGSEKQAQGQCEQNDLLHDFRLL